MNKFHTTLAYINETLYAPAGFIADSIREEPQNAEYGAGTFQLGALSVRFRVAKITPTKTGQFVAMWEKMPSVKTRPSPMPMPLISWSLTPSIPLAGSLDSLSFLRTC